MDELQSKVEQNRVFLVENVRYDDIRHYLRQEIFSRDNDEEIEACVTNTGKMKKCLDLMSYIDKTYNAYQVFMKSLEDVYPHVIEKIKDTEVKIPLKRPEHIHKPLQGTLERKTVFKLVKQSEVMKSWKDLGRLLNINEGNLTNIEYAHPRDLKECAYQMLEHWKEQNCAADATNEKIYQALVDLDLSRVACEVFEQ